MSTKSARKAVKQQGRGTGGAGVPKAPASATPGPTPVADDLIADDALNGAARSGADAQADSDATVGADAGAKPETAAVESAGSMANGARGVDRNGADVKAVQENKRTRAVVAPQADAPGDAPSKPDGKPGAEQLSVHDAPVAAAKTSRAGRNLPAAIGVSVVLGAVILIALLTVRQVFIGVVAAAVAVSTVELAGAFRRSAKNIQVALIPVLVGGQAMVWLSWAWRTQGILAGFVLTMLACLAWRFRGGSEGYLRDVTASIFTAAYVPLFASFAAMLVEPHDGTARVLCFMIVVVCSDTGGYIGGVLFGKHPMAPSISPKKSWEGFAGSMLAGCVAASLAMALLLHAHWWLGLPFGAAIVLTATGGDLTESLIKRDLGIKDMGNLLPGHGGLMDRMDSLLPSAVVSWVLLSLLLPV